MTLPPLWLIVAASCLPVFTATQHKPRSPLFCFPWLLTVDSRSVAHCCRLISYLVTHSELQSDSKSLFCGYPTPTSFLRLSPTGWSGIVHWKKSSIAVAWGTYRIHMSILNLISPRPMKISIPRQCVKYGDWMARKNLSALDAIWESVFLWLTEWQKHGREPCRLNHECKEWMQDVGTPWFHQTR